jgi:uncharacterized membrane protein YdjX (TVP38/TMEM64 family)
MTDSPARHPKALLVKLALAGVAGAVVAAVVLQVFGWQRAWTGARQLYEAGMALIRGAGPVAFFTAMALTPALGVPLMAFSLTAGPVFGERLGIGWVIVLALLATTTNIVLTYFLARRALRPLLQQLMARLGYRLPEVEAGDEADLIFLLRVTPGLPFFAQNYLLGLAGVSFRKYVLISCVVQCTFCAGFVLFGDALSQGKGKLALTALLLLLALTAGTHLARKHYERRKVAPRS